VSKKHRDRIARRVAAVEAAQQALEDAVLDAHLDPVEPASVRELGKLDGLSAATVQRWIARRKAE
jgi:hypothetical protein